MLVTRLVSHVLMGPYVELSAHCVLVARYGFMQLFNAVASALRSPGEKVASALCTSISHMRSEREMGGWAGGLIEGEWEGEFVDRGVVTHITMKKWRRMICELSES